MSKTRVDTMTAKEFYDKEKPYKWGSDDPQEDEGYYGRSDMVRFAEAYHNHRLEAIVEGMEDACGKFPNINHEEDNYDAGWNNGLHEGIRLINQHHKE